MKSLHCDHVIRWLGKEHKSGCISMHESTRFDASVVCGLVVLVVCVCACRCDNGHGYGMVNQVILQVGDNISEYR